MQSEITSRSKSLYDADYQLWIEETVAHLKAQDFRQIDLANLIEEIESLGKSEKRAISSYLMRLCEHLLKIKYWESERETCSRGWKLEVRNFRLQIAELLEDSPSLQSFLQDNFDKQYRNGRELFLSESELNDRLVPKDPDFTLEQALNKNWLP
jgi:hypothetical protein